MVFTNTTKNLFLVTVVLIFVITPYVAKASDDSNNGNLTLFRIQVLLTTVKMVVQYPISRESNLTSIQTSSKYLAHFTPFLTAFTLTMRAYS
jgi:hypothetical protein